MAELKLVWLVIMTDDDQKNISSPACVNLDEDNIKS